MPTFRIPSLREVIDGTKEAITGLIPDAGLGEGEDYDNEAAYMGGMVWQLYNPIGYVEDQIFPDTASLENLIRHGRLHGVDRKGLSRAEGLLLLTGTAGAVQAVNTVSASASAVEVITSAAVTLVLPAWADKKVIGYDPTRANVVVLNETIGMAVGDCLQMGGQTYSIKDLPGGGTLIVHGHFKVPPIPGYIIKAVAGATVPAAAVLAGGAGNLPYDTSLTINGPGAGVDPKALVLVLSGGDDIEDPARWALRIQEVKVERAGGGNRSQVLTWALEVLGVDRAFVYDVFRGLGTGDVVGQGVRGARHLNAGKLTEMQNHIRPFVPTPANPGKATMGGHDILITDFTDRPVTVELELTGGPGYGPDWQGSLLTAPGCTELRINTFENPLGVVVAGNRVVLPVGAKFLELGEVQAVDAAGFSLVAPLSLPPAAGLTILPGSSLVEPVRDQLLSMFEELGPGDTDPPTRYPAPTVYAPAQLSLNLIHATVRKVLGLSNCHVLQPATDITPVPKAQCVPLALILRHTT